MASKNYHIKFHASKDAEIIARLEAQDNKNDYIRKLILSDIAADILRAHIHLTDPDPDERYENVRQDWYNAHCPAISNPDYDCIGCYYAKHPKDDPWSDVVHCSADAAFEEYWEVLNNGKE